LIGCNNVLATEYYLSPQDKMDGFVPAHFLGWYIKVCFIPSLTLIHSHGTGWNKVLA
jgi:hypothetical protein